MKKISSQGLFLLLALAGSASSCSDLLTHDSDLLIPADKEHLNSATDTLSSVIGIQNKLQALADRTVLLGEARGDLVQVNNYADGDLRDLAYFQVGADNKYNEPRDYYAVINNCNYFLANVDADLRNNRNELVFAKEIAAVRAYRAWTYLQLAMIYGSVPFVTEPLLDMNIDESQFPQYNLKQICDYFIPDLSPYVNTPFPGYGDIGSVDSRLTFFPVNVLLGEMNLWAGNYREAALCYYRYIASRNGSHTSWPLTNGALQWTRDDGKFQQFSNGWTSMCFDAATEGFTTTGEVVTYIPGDSVSSSKNYSSLRNLFSTTTQNDGYYSLEPSPAMIQLSAQQVYCNKSTTGEVSYAPNNLENYRTGDLRLCAAWKTYTYNFAGLATTTGRPTGQSVEKFTTTNVHLWRRATIYLHMAEALNRAGFPEFAHRILATGVNNKVMNELMQIYPADVDYLQQFDFPNADYVLRTEMSLSYTTIGIHSRGSGFSEVNEYYQMPEGTLDEQILAIEDRIVEEEALELAFEGQRYYDLMRVALRRADPAYLSSRIYARQGDTSLNDIAVDLNNTSNWYLKLY